MRLRYLHLQNYPPIREIELAFASGSPLGRECAIRFVVGVNGSGKSNLLRAIAETFLAVSDGRMPPFPVSLMYELGQRGQRDHYTVLVDCAGTKAEASIWVAQGFHWPDDTPLQQMSAAVEELRTSSTRTHEGFEALVPKGTWPQQATIALPKAVLAYTTGDLRPWRSVWSRDQNSEGLLDEDLAEGAASDERPSGWTSHQEAVLQAALRAPGETKEGAAAALLRSPSTELPAFRRPVLLDATLLKCALLAVALPQSFVHTTDTQSHTATVAAMAKSLGPSDIKTPLQELLERGGWNHLVSVAFRSRMQPESWDQKTCEAAHDWWLCASEVISEPHPLEARRVVFFDLKESFNPGDHRFLSPLREDVQTATTHGEALWALLGGATDVTVFELFTRMLELNRAGLFEDVQLRMRRHLKPEPGDTSIPDDIGVLRYEELSDGEQMVLGRMALFHLLRGQQDALLLLDEPETHFNDKWKREIVDIIDDAIGQTANDVLISTHSAIVLSDVFSDEIVVVEKAPDGSIIRSVDEPTFASDPSALMMMIFGAEDSIGKRAQEYIECRLRDSRGSSEDIKQVEALISKMGSGFYRSELRTLLNTWRDANA